MYKVPTFLANTSPVINYTDLQANQLKNGARRICFEYPENERNICRDKIETMFKSCNDCILTGAHCNQRPEIPTGIDEPFEVEELELGYKSGMTCADIIVTTNIIRNKYP